MRTLIVLVSLLATLASTTAAQSQMLIERLDGPITAKELQSFKDYVRALPPPKDNHHNGMVYGVAGETTEGLGYLYDATHDPEVLDLLVNYADRLLAARNDPVNGRLIWTGKRELTWPNKGLDEKYPGSSSTENGDVMSHILFAAELILKDKSLWNGKPSFGDPFNFGPTYLDRAKTYVRECDRTIDTFILPWIVRPDSNRYYFPDSPLYDAVDGKPADFVRPKDRPVPWNQQMMLNGAFQRAAVCHEILGDDPARVGHYDAIVKTSCDWFVSELTPYKVDGHGCFKWAYPPADNLRHVEDVPHGGYDILLYRAYVSGRYGVKKETMQGLANTTFYVMAKPDGTFAKRTDGENGTRSALGGTWLLLSDIEPQLYIKIAQADLKRAKTQPFSDAMILWAKNKNDQRTAGEREAEK
jgi:hypothetical protein